MGSATWTQQRGMLRGGISCTSCWFGMYSLQKTLTLPSLPYRMTFFWNTATPHTVVQGTP